MSIGIHSVLLLVLKKFEGYKGLQNVSVFCSFTCKDQSPQDHSTLLMPSFLSRALNQPTEIRGLLQIEHPNLKVHFRTKERRQIFFSTRHNTALKAACLKAPVSMGSPLLLPQPKSNVT